MYKGTSLLRCYKYWYVFAFNQTCTDVQRVPQTHETKARKPDQPLDYQHVNAAEIAEPLQGMSRKLLPSDQM
jgi:hypothetical protein